MEKYEPLGVVGEGSYGVVLKCKCRDNGRVVAIKKFIDSEDDQNVRKIALREIRVLRKLRHENLVNLIEVFRRRKHIYLVFEFIDHTLLDELEQKSHGLEEETCREYVFQVLRGLNFCHENNIIHRDVKPENVLVSKSGIVKLCDFGFARNMAGPGEVFTDYVATRWYRAPELLVMDVAYGKEVDVWALGCLFAEMMTGEPLFPGDSDIDQLFLIAQCLGRLSKRHLNIMQRNSAFRGFQFPEPSSRHGSTASISSNHSKLSAPANKDQENGDDRLFKPKPSSKIASGSRKKRLTVERSVFSSMFPSWSDETIHFLTLCLDPEPSGRPSCSSLLRLPYFTHDAFPSRFLPELTAKMELEGPSPPTLFSRKSVKNAGNVTSSSISPPVKNPLHQTRPNLNTIDDEPTPITPPEAKAQLKSSNMINFQNSAKNPPPAPFTLPKDKTFVVAPPRKPSFSLGPEPSLANDTKIPHLLSRKYSNESLSPPAATSKSTSNLDDCSKRLSIQITTPLLFQNPSYQASQPAPGPKKYSFSFPPPNMTPQDGEKSGESSPTKSTQLPVTTLTFSMATSTQALGKPPSGTGTTSQTFSTYQKRASPTTMTKPKTFSNTSSYFPQAVGYHNGSQSGNTFTYQNSLGNSKSLPVTIFGSSMLRNGNHANGNTYSVTESFLPRMTGKSTMGGKTGDDNIGGILSNGSPPKNVTSALNKKREKWDQQVQQTGRKFSVFNGSNDGN